MMVRLFLCINQNLTSNSPPPPPHPPLAPSSYVTHSFLVVSYTTSRGSVPWPVPPSVQFVPDADSREIEGAPEDASRAIRKWFATEQKSWEPGSLILIFDGAVFISATFDVTWKCTYHFVWVLFAYEVSTDWGFARYQSAIRQMDLGGPGARTSFFVPVSGGVSHMFQSKISKSPLSSRNGRLQRRFVRDYHSFTKRKEWLSSRK